jgi:hypothetical protein
MRNYSDSLFALVSSNYPTFGTNCQNQAFLDRGASDEIQLTMNLALSRLKMTTSLHVCFFAMMDEIDRLFLL